MSKASGHVEVDERRLLILLAGRLGYDVTAVELSEGRLARLRARTASEGLLSPVDHAAADELPEGRCDLVISRHLL